MSFGTACDTLVEMLKWIITLLDWFKHKVCDDLEKMEMYIGTVWITFTRIHDSYFSQISLTLKFIQILFCVSSIMFKYFQKKQLNFGFLQQYQLCSQLYMIYSCFGEPASQILVRNWRHKGRSSCRCYWDLYSIIRYCLVLCCTYIY